MLRFPRYICSKWWTTDPSVKHANGDPKGQLRDDNLQGIPSLGHSFSGIIGHMQPSCKKQDVTTLVKIYAPVLHMVVNTVGLMVSSTSSSCPLALPLPTPSIFNSILLLCSSQMSSAIPVLRFASAHFPLCFSLVTFLIVKYAFFSSICFPMAKVNDSAWWQTWTLAAMDEPHQSQFRFRGSIPQLSWSLGHSKWQHLHEVNHLDPYQWIEW